MDQNTLIQNLRTALVRSGATELPAFPGVLPYSWSHPEILARCFMPGEGGWYGFPLIVAGDDLPGSADSCATGFIWLKKPFQASMIPRLQEIIPAALGCEDRWPSAALRLVGQAYPVTPTLELGCAWRLFCRGCECGEVRIISGFGGERLPQPVGLVSLSVLTLTKMGNGDLNLPSIPWGKDLLHSDILGWRFPQRAFGIDPVSPEEMVRKRAERVTAGLDQALARKSVAEVLQGVVEGGLLCRAIEARGMDQSVVGREAVAAFRLRLKKCLPVVAKAWPSAGTNSKGQKEGVLR